MNESPAWLLMFGRLHLLVIHFPIALVVVAAAVECTRPLFLRRDNEDRARPSNVALTCIVLGAIASLITAWTGWTYADREFGTDDPAIELHRWLGVAAFGLATLAALTGAIAAWMQDEIPVRWYRLSLVVAAVGVGFAGHFGGALVHGSTHLIDPLLERRSSHDADEPVEVQSEDNDTEAENRGPFHGVDLMAPDVTWDDALVVLEAHCTRCHNAKRSRGGVRVDTIAEINNIIAPGRPEESDLIRVLLLPESDPLQMPKNKPSLREADILLLARFVAQYDDLKDDDPFDALMELLDDDTGVSAPPDDDAMHRLRSAGFVAKRRIPASFMTEVRAMPSASIEQPVIDDVNALSETIEVLDLSKSDVTDEHLAGLIELPRLIHLRLGGTGVTDAGVSSLLTRCPRIEILDVHRTSLTDGVLGAIEEHTGLTRVYAWNTGVTKRGIRAMSGDVAVDIGE